MAGPQKRMVRWWLGPESELSGGGWVPKANCPVVAEPQKANCPVVAGPQKRIVRWWPLKANCPGVLGALQRVFRPVTARKWTSLSARDDEVEPVSQKSVPGSKKTDFLPGTGVPKYDQDPARAASKRCQSTVFSVRKLRSGRGTPGPPASGPAEASSGPAEINKNHAFL